MLRRVLPIVLLTVGCYAYVVVTPTGFVYDDRRFVQNNEAVHDLSNLTRYFTDPTTVDPKAWTGIYRPLRTLDFAIDWAIAGPSPRWFHFRNLLYHLLGAYLVLLLLRRWGAGEVGAVLGTLVFALHPAQVEAVAWITSRGDLMCLVFFLLALLLHQRSAGMDRWFAGAAGVLVLSLLSKEAAVMFPAAAFLADWFFRDERKPARTFRRWPQYLVYGVLAGLYFWLWTSVHAARGAPWWHLQVRWGGSLFGTALTMSRGFVYYLRLLLFPVDMSTEYYLAPVSSPDPITILCALVVIGLLVFALRSALLGRPQKKGRLFTAFAVLWFFVTMFPTSNLPAPIGIPTAERFLYLPLVGVALAAGLLLARIFERGIAGRVVSALLLVCLGAVSFERTMLWKSEPAFWTGILARTTSPRALEWSARQLRERGAEMKLEAQRLLDRDEVDVGRRLVEKADGLLEESVGIYDRVIDLWRKLPAAEGLVAKTRSVRAHAYFELGQYELALRESREILDFWPDLPFANLVKAMSLHALGWHRAAARVGERALEIEDTPVFRKKLAAIYEDLAQWEEERVPPYRARSYAALQRAWELLPSPRDNSGVLEALQEIETGFEAQVGPLKQATQQRPDDAQAWIELAERFALYGFYEPAGRVFDKLMTPEQLGRTPRVLVPYAFSFWESRDTLEGYDEAERIYREIAKSQPELPGLAEALERVERERAALKESLAR